MTTAMKEENIKVRLETAMLKKLREQAKQNERTVAGEIRLAIRKHLEKP